MYQEKVLIEGVEAKVEVFDRDHKLAKSLPVHIKALSSGLHLPKILKVEYQNGTIFKYTEWIQGKTLHEEMNKFPDKIEIICESLAKYVLTLYSVNKITAVDSHFKNFVWNNNQVIYVDLKKLLFNDQHILQMSKICLKSCKGDRKKALAFLRGYSKLKDVKSILSDCEERNWEWGTCKIEPIKFEEIRHGQQRAEKKNK